MWGGRLRHCWRCRWRGPTTLAAPRRWQIPKCMGTALAASERSSAREAVRLLVSVSWRRFLLSLQSSDVRVLRVSLTSVMYVDFELSALSDNIGF